MKIETRTLKEVFEKAERDTAELKQAIDSGEKTWGRWKYNPTAPASIDIEQIEIELNRIDDSDKLMEWILHLSRKNWITADDLGQLVYAVQDLEEVGYHELSVREVYC